MSLKQLGDLALLQFDIAIGTNAARHNLLALSALLLLVEVPDIFLNRLPHNKRLDKHLARLA